MSKDQFISARKSALKTIESAISKAMDHDLLHTEVIKLSNELTACLRFQENNPTYKEQLENLRSENNRLYNLAGIKALEFNGVAE